jgi:hypothetical protein
MGLRNSLQSLLGEILAAKHLSAREDPVEELTKAVDVALEIGLDTGAQFEFRRCKHATAKRLTGSGLENARGIELTDTEVDEIGSSSGLTRLVHNDIAWLDVAMNDPGPVRVGHGLYNVSIEVEPFVEFKVFGLHNCFESRPQVRVH